jgi:hypothetical protein
VEDEGPLSVQCVCKGVPFTDSKSSRSTALGWSVKIVLNKANLSLQANHLGAPPPLGKGNADVTHVTVCVTRRHTRGMYEKGSLEDWLCLKWLRIRLIRALIPFSFVGEGSDGS